MSEPKAYPLQWPAGWPKTEPHAREIAKFKQTLASALAKLKGEIRRMNGAAFVLSSNCTLGNENPKESGIVAYFLLDNQPMAIPCDRWKHVNDNVYAVALTIEAMRGIDRWGAKSMIKAVFTGFKALPQKGSGIDPLKVLGISHPNPTEAEITAAFRGKSKLHHPDIPGTGDAAKWAEIREAHDLLMAGAKK